jgi:hypothetical protein
VLYTHWFLIGRIQISKHAFTTFCVNLLTLAGLKTYICNLLMAEGPCWPAAIKEQNIPRVSRAKMVANALRYAE